MRALLLYAATLFAGAFLIFWIEPVAGKVLLPVFGGAPATWNVCLAFFQAALLLGYLYAHALCRALAPRAAALVHVALLAAAVLWLAPRAHEALAAAPGPGLAPPWRILGALSAGIGLVFVLLAATSSLVQSWFSRSGHPRAGDPYFLYAASNLGSFGALVCFPLLLEPHLGVEAQWRGWRWGAAGLAALIAGCALAPGLRGAAKAPRAAAAGSGPRERLSWVLWSFAPSSLLVGVTTYISTDIIAMPLLWAVPMGIYLGVFAWVFGRRSTPGPRTEALLSRALCAGVLLAVTSAIFGYDHPAELFIPLHLALFALACRVCLGRVASERPGPERLTEYYLWLSVGGVLGGFFNSLLAPALFNTVAEYPLVMILACACRPRAPAGAQPAAAPGAGIARELLIPALCAAWLCAALKGLPAAGVSSATAVQLVAVLPVITACFASVRRPARYGLCLVALFAAGSVALQLPGDEVLYRARTFYGVLKVLRRTEQGLIYLVHGSTSHGIQPLDPARRLEPVSYYSRRGPAGQLFEAPRPRVAVVGLGAGALSAYARAGERWTYYELDPGVAAIASDPGYFTYLSGSRARATTAIILGDARLRLADAPDGALDLLVIDAFSSDAVPAHLMTGEALELYLRKLAPGGLVAFHVSNRFLRLAPVIGAIAASRGVVARVRGDLRGFGPGSARPGEQPSVWVVVARGEGDLGTLAGDPRWLEINWEPRFAWTDDFYNLAGLIRW